MKHIKLFEAFKSSLLNKFANSEGFIRYLRDYCESNDIILSSISDIIDNEEIITFMNAIDGAKKIGEDYLKFFFNDDTNRLAFVLDGYNIEQPLRVSHRDRERFPDNDNDEDDDDYHTKVLEFIVKNADYCIVLNTDKLSSFLGLGEIKKTRENNIKNAAAFVQNSTVSRLNNKRYEDIIYGSYGFYDSIENFNKGIKRFTNRLFNTIPPIILISESREIKTLFELVFKYQKASELINASDKEQEETLENYKRLIIETAKELITLGNFTDWKNLNAETEKKQYLEYLEGYGHDEDSLVVKNASVIYDELFPLFEEFNKNFAIDRKIKDNSDFYLLYKDINILEDSHEFEISHSNLPKFVYQKEYYRLRSTTQNKTINVNNWKYFIKTILRIFSK